MVKTRARIGVRAVIRARLRVRDGIKVRAWVVKQLLDKIRQVFKKTYRHKKGLTL